MATAHEPEAASSQSEDLPKPRLWWLAAFHVAVIGIVVVLARLTTGFANGPLLEEELRELTGAPVPSGVPQPSWSGRG